MEFPENPTQEDSDALAERARNNPPLHKREETEQDNCDRLTGRVTLVHEACGFDTTNVNSTFVLRLKNKQQPFTRRLRVGEQETKLDLQWTESAGYLVITNKKQIGKTLLPSKTEREEHEQHKIIVCIDNIPIFVIRPEHSFMAELISKDQIEHISIRSNKGEAAVMLTVMPQ